VVILTDVLKAVVALWLSGVVLRLFDIGDGDIVFVVAKYWAALFCLLGHMFPAMFGFKGGKGILSGVTVALCLDWRIGLFVFGIFLVAYWSTHYVSLGSILSSGSFGFIYAFFHWDEKFAVCVSFFLSFLIVWLHRSNLQRLLKGQERKTNLFGKGNQS
jgi:glycerol-3-phosphate acyltransferase PlsY